ncbi:hypothetical protein EVAR_7397_1 [Eumeta japonica]|uniref:Uncharacterized protein n=1 Tax=Eumeta variegata TaxID=151549 RepID=A0A4C1V9F5_EUMVA|nr:hypothetical protein EVAR_7397_1 [Eumeta japonica]
MCDGRCCEWAPGPRRSPGAPAVSPNPRPGRACTYTEPYADIRPRHLDGIFFYGTSNKISPWDRKKNSSKKKHPSVDKRRRERYDSTATVTPAHVHARVGASLDAIRGSRTPGRRAAWGGEGVPRLVNAESQGYIGLVVFELFDKHSSSASREKSVHRLAFCPRGTTMVPIASNNYCLRVDRRARLYNNREKGDLFWSARAARGRESGRPSLVTFRVRRCRFRVPKPSDSATLEREPATRRGVVGERAALVSRARNSVRDVRFVSDPRASRPGRRRRDGDGATRANKMAARCRNLAHLTVLTPHSDKLRRSAARSRTAALALFPT